MSHSFGSGNSSQNVFLNKKRLEADIPIENRYHYTKYSKYEQYSPNLRYNTMNYMHSKPPPGNPYYNIHYRGGNYHNPQKSFKRDFKKPFKKYYSSPNANEGIRNLSNCEMTPSPPRDTSLGKIEENSSTKFDSNYSTPGLNIDKYVSNITQQNLNIEFKLSSTPKLKYKDKLLEEAKNEDEEELPVFQFPMPPEKVHHFQPFNRRLVKLEPNPLDHFDLYPKNLFENVRYNSSVANSNKYLNNIENIIKLKSCYLLAKIPNWRLVTNFVPASALNKETFQNFDKILNLDEKAKEDWVIPPEKSSIVFNQKYEELVEKFLEQNMNKNRQVEMTNYNLKFIVAQYQYDIIKIKNKINQNKYKIDCLNIKQENLRNAIEHKIKD